VNIIIAGAGQVGYNLAKSLSYSHNVTIIDRNRKALDLVGESLDVLAIEGDIDSPLTYKKLIQNRYDLFVALTNSDEANIISSLIIDDILEVEKKFIRLKNTFYSHSSIKEKLNIAELFFPILLSAKTLSKLLDYPRANNIKSFKYTPFKLISIRVKKEVPFIEEKNFALVGIERDKQFFIPKDEYEIKENDLLYFFGDEVEIRKLCASLEDSMPLNIKYCAIFGADSLSIEIAKELLSRDIEVKLIDEDFRSCQIANELLEGRATIINSRYDAHSLFDREGVKYADMVICSRDSDEFNIVKALEAKEYGINKVVAINNDLAYYNLMHSLGLIVVRGPKMSAFYSILESIYSDNIIMQKSFCGGKGVIFLRKLFKNSPLIGKKIKKVPTFLVFIIRNNQLLKVKEKELLEEEDIIVAFGTKEDYDKLKRWLYEL